MDVISGKIALITGGATGIGAAYVNRLFKGGMKGCTIVDIDERGEALAAEMNCCYGKNKAIFIKADVTNKEAFENVFKANMKKYRTLDLLINNAGIFRDRTWNQMIDLNVASTVRGSLLGIKYMGKNNGSRGGTIVNTSSIAGLKSLSPSPCYAATKHFVIGFTRSIGTKFWLDLTGIRFLTVCPGVCITPLINDAPQWVFDGFPGLDRVMIKTLKNDGEQTVEQMAEGLNTMLNTGENGSIWVCEKGMPIFELEIPSIHEMKKSRQSCNV